MQEECITLITSHPINLNDIITINLIEEYGFKKFTIMIKLEGNTETIISTRSDNMI